MSAYPKLSSDEVSVLTEFFNFVDTNHDGYITVEEIKMACAVDINGDGIISNEEILKGAGVWLNSYLSQQDLDMDAKVSLQELLKFNNDTKN